MSKRKHIIHVNQHVIKANRKEGAEIAPPLTVKNYEDNRYAMEAILRDAAGNEVGRFVYRPNDPLGCGAHVWFETHLDLELVGEQSWNEVCEVIR